MIRKRTVIQAVSAALSAPAVLAAIVVLAAVLFAGCSSPYSSPNWPYGSGGGHTPGGGGLNPLSLDTTPPGVITHLAAHTGSNTVTFIWQDPADSDFDHVEIWFGTSPSATSGTSVPSVSRGTMTAAWNGTPNETLFCHFIAVDTAGNRSAVVNYAVKLEAVMADVTNLAGTITGADSVTLTWTDPIAPTFDHVEISSGGLPNQTAAKGLGTYTWSGLSTGTSYTFTVTAFYTGGGSSTGVPVTLILTQDLIPPGKVTGLTASNDDFGSVKLDWTNPGDPDLQYVEITCEPFIGPAKTVNASAGTYTWNGLAGGVTYTFTVKAVDHSGNRSEGVSVSGTTYDTTPAGPVTGLEGIPGDGNVVLTWTDPGDADLAYIQIECNEIPGPAQNVYPGTGTYTWSALAKGSSYTFTVTTRDTQGNLGAAVTVGPVPVILAGGGTISLVKVEGSSPLKWWEIHTFTTSGALTFPSGYTSVTADYLIVAGGGGAGHSGVYDCAGGGGAGGLLYKTGQTLSLTGSAVTVTVGAGGAANGGNGGTSSIGTAVAPGGGGGGNTDATGKDGGSGGGGGAGAGTLSYSGGKGADTLKATNSLYIDIEGYNGAAGSTGIPGGGGGGAAGMGIVGGSGGAPWNAAAAGAAWIAAAATTNEFSRGGNAAGTGSGGAAGKNYGDGGSGGERGANMDGGAGHGGVVVIRFQRD